MPKGEVIMKKEIKNEKKKVINKNLVYSAIFLSLFVVLSILVITDITDPIDSAIASSIIGIRNDRLTKIMISITNIGSAYSLIVITILITLIAIIRNKRLPWHTIENLIAVFLTSQLFKIIFRRARPTGLLLVPVSGYSYPSGHTMVSFAYFIFITIALSERINNKFLKISAKIGTPILIILIGFSRIYLGVHHTTDVIAAYLLGAAYLFVFLDIRNKNNQKKELQTTKKKKVKSEEK